MSKLNYNQKKTLAIYERFFGERYVTNSDKEGNTDIHVATQKMCYLLKVAGIEVGEFDYSWNIKGPFSPGLLVLLRSIDRNDSEVLDFYNNDTKQMDYYDNQVLKIDSLREKLKIKEHRDNYVRWVEILGSITYIARAILPGSDFDIVNKRFMLEKKDYNNIIENKTAWELLINAELIHHNFEK